MDKLWAPWRIDYIKRPKVKGKACIFCRSLKSKQQKYIVLKNKFSFAILNTFPYNNGHILVMPKRHIGSLEALRSEEITDIFQTLKQAKGLLDKAMKPKGYNLGINIGASGGAGIPEHLHIHIVPRWASDTNFMPVVSNTKVIPQSLDELCKQLNRFKNKDKKSKC